jgi:hypothetical protein
MIFNEKKIDWDDYYFFIFTGLLFINKINILLVIFIFIQFNNFIFYLKKINFLFLFFYSLLL